MKSIFNYYNYQQFLLDFYNAKKAENAYFSYRFMSSKLDLDPGFLVKVLQGKLHISLKSVKKFTTLCKLNERESEYFRAMVEYGKAKKQSDIKRTFEKLISFRTKTKTLEDYQYEFYDKWYYSAIWSLLTIAPFDGNYDKLASRLIPAISAKQAKHSIDLLEKLDFIEKKAGGKYEAKEFFITSGEKWKRVAVNKFQKDTLDLAHNALDTVNKELRDISTLTLAISHKDIPEIKERLSEFRKSLLNLSNENDFDADCIYQLNLQLIPLTTVEGKKQNAKI